MHFSGYKNVIKVGGKVVLGLLVAHLVLFNGKITQKVYRYSAEERRNNSIGWNTQNSHSGV